MCVICTLLRIDTSTNPHTKHMTMKKILSLIVVAFMLATSSAQAVDKVGAYVGVDVGAGFTTDTVDDTAQNLVNVNGGIATVEQKLGAAVGRICLGYNVNKTFAVELGYIATGDYEEDAAGISSTDVAYGYSAKASVSGLDYSLLIRPVKSLNGLFAKVGGHSLETTMEYSAVNMTSLSGETTKSGSGYLVGIGYDTPISDSINTRVAYTYYNSVSGLDNTDLNMLTVGIYANF